MAAQRAPRGMERNGVAIAVALHVLVIGLLSVQWTAGDRRFDNPPMEVDLIAETAATSTAPEISELPPAARLGEEYATDIPAPEPVPTPPLPEPIAAPTPAPSPRQVTRPKPAPPKKQQPAQKAQPKPSPKATPKPKDKPTRPTGRLDGIAEGLSRSQPKQSSSKGAPAAATAAEIRRSVRASINAAVIPKWNACKISGLDIDKLKTTISFRLTRGGRLAGFVDVETTGETENNKFYVKRYQECAKRSIELSAPFDDLPEDNYGFWETSTLDFTKR